MEEVYYVIINNLLPRCPWQNPGPRTRMRTDEEDETTVRAPQTQIQEAARPLGDYTVPKNGLALVDRGYYLGFAGLIVILGGVVLLKAKPDWINPTRLGPGPDWSALRRRFPGSALAGIFGIHRADSRQQASRKPRLDRPRRHRHHHGRAGNRRPVHRPILHLYPRFSKVAVSWLSLR